MSIFKSKDDREIERFEKQEAEILMKFYGLRKTDKNCPKDAYLLYPDRLHLYSYEILTPGKIKLNIMHQTPWSGFISDSLRVNYDQIVIGTLFCEDVETISETTYNRIGTITRTLFSNTKILNLPVLNEYNIEIRCKIIKVESMGIYVAQEDQLISNDDYLKSLEKSLKINMT